MEAHLPIKQNVLRLQVAVVNLVLMAVVQRRDDVHKVAPRLVLWQPAAFGDPVEELSPLVLGRGRCTSVCAPPPGSRHRTSLPGSRLLPPDLAPRRPDLAELHYHVDPLLVHVDLEGEGAVPGLGDLESTCTPSTSTPEGEGGGGEGDSGGDGGGACTPRSRTMCG
jgi:hypothetical protein